MTTFAYFSLDPPRQWRAGYAGADQKPFYFGCADCGAEEPEIAGVLADADQPVSLETIAVKAVDGGPFVKAQMFCAECYARRPAEAVPVNERPVPTPHS